MIIEVIEQALQTHEDAAEQRHFAHVALIWKQQFEDSLIAFCIGLFH